MVEDKAGNSKGKALVVWKESENEIEIQTNMDSQRIRIVSCVQSYCIKQGMQRGIRI